MQGTCYKLWSKEIRLRCRARRVNRPYKPCVMQFVCRDKVNVKANRYTHNSAKWFAIMDSSGYTTYGILPANIHLYVACPSHTFHSSIARLSPSKTMRCQVFAAPNARHFANPRRSDARFHTRRTYLLTKSLGLGRISIAQL